MNGVPEWVTEVLQPQPSDSSDLRWAVEIAVELWQRGNKPQSLKWLREAIQTAGGDGRPQRADALARALHSLEQAPSDQSQSPPPPSAQPSSKRRLAPTAPYQIAVDAPTQLGGPSDELLAQTVPSARGRDADTDPDFPAVLTPQPAKQKALTRPMPPSVRPDRAESTVVMLPNGAARRAAVAEERGSPSGGPRSSDAPVTLESPAAPLTPMQALRVAVQPGKGVELVVVRLDGDEPVPAGMQEALLLPIKT